MRNTYGTTGATTSYPDPHTVAIRDAWKTYWAAVAVGDEDAKARAKSRIERFEIMALTRRSTAKMLAVVAEALP